jgi:O-methyltransferase
MQLAKHVVKAVLQQVTASVYRNRALSSWPAYMGWLHEVTVPRSIVPNPTPQPLGAANINNLTYLIDKTKAVPGDIAECGVFRGQSLVAMAVYVRHNNIPKRVLGFDSFEGFPESVAIDATLGGTHKEWKIRGVMNETSYDLVFSKLRRFRVDDNVVLVKGFFENTLPNYADTRFSLVHLDCDTYSSYKECMEFFYPRMSTGGVIILDEYNDPPWPGCNKAIDEFLIDKPEKLQKITFDNYEKYYIARL